MSYRALLIAVAVIIAGGLAAWYATTSMKPRVSHGPDQTQFQQPQPELESSVEVYLYIDPLTKCQYLYKWRTGLTPRLTSDGRPMCQ